MEHNHNKIIDQKIFLHIKWSISEIHYTGSEISFYIYIPLSNTQLIQLIY